MRQQVLNTVTTVDTSPDSKTHVEYVRQDEMAASPFDAAAGGQNAPVSISYGVQQQTVHSIAGVAWSYSATPTGGGLQILNGAGSLVFNIDITAGGPGSFTFPTPLQGSPGKSVIVTLLAGSGTVTGKLSVLGHRAVQLPIAASPLSLDFSQAADSGFLPVIGL